LALKRLLNYIGWPTASGILLAALIIVLFPQVLQKNTDENGGNFSLSDLSPNNDNWEGPVSYASAVQRATPAVVNIYTRTKLKRRRHPLFDDPLYRHFFNNADLPRQERMQQALGSGVIIKRDGYILTNNHVIAGADEIVVLLTDGREARATPVGTDPDTDLAVLKINLDNLTVINVGLPESMQVGDVVLAIGNPFGVGQTVTQGIVSATGRYGLGLNRYENYIQTDAAINPGSSGGALIDAYGNLVGINTAILDQRAGSTTSVGIGFAIPAEIAINILNDIVEFGHVARGWLGIEAQQLSPQMARSYNLSSSNGVVITSIYNNGPAHRAGLKPGDIITRINNEPIGDGRRGMTQIAQSRPGESVAIEVLRNGKTQVITAVLGTMPPRTG